MDKRWKIHVNGMELDANPLYSGLTIDEVQEQDQVFYIPKLNSSVKLQRTDYKRVINTAFDHVIQLDYQQKISGIWETLYSGTFTRTDCEVYEDDVKGSITVNPTPLNRYTKLLQSYDKKFNIVDLVPQTQTLDYDVRPIIQIYVAGAPVLTNYVGGSYWEQDVLEPTADEDLLIDTYFFNRASTTNYSLKIIVPGVGDGLSPDVSGEYEWESSTGTQTDYTRKSDGKYVFRAVGDKNDTNVGTTLSAGTLDNEDDFYSTWMVDDGSFEEWVYIGYDDDNSTHIWQRTDSDNTFPSAPFDMVHVSGATNTGTLTISAVTDPSEPYRWTIYDTVGTDYVYVAPFRTKIHNEGTTYNTSATFTSLTDSTSQVRVFAPIVYARIISNKGLHSQPVYGTETPLFPNLTTDIPENDFVPRNDNYTKVMPLFFDEIIIDDAQQSTYSKYGRFAEDALHFAEDYFSPYSHAQPIFPIQQSQWNEYSLWMYYPDWLTDLQNDDVTQRTLRHAYKVSNVLKYMLAEIDDTLTHEEAEAYSDYFYAASNTIRGSKRTPFITPKSNLMSGDYDVPARKGELTLGELLGMERKVFNAYLDILEDKKTILEHIDFYERGGRYSGNNIGADLTKLKNPRNGQLWSFATKKYTFDKHQIPEIIRYEWMDEVSDAFSGSDVVFTSNYVQKGLIEDMNISRFTSDVDYILAQPSSVSKDGFVLMDATFSNDRYVLPYLTTTVDGVDYKLQNGYLSMLWLQENYLKYNMPASEVTINGTSTTATTVKKSKKQEVEFPAQYIINPQRLITSSIGNGKINKITTNTDNGLRKVTLYHGTES